MKKNGLSLIASVLLIVLFSCNTENSDLAPLTSSEKYEVKSGDMTFFSDSEKYKETNARRGQSDDCKFPVDILKVNRNENELTISISRPKSCKVKYEFIWDGIILESYPMMANIFIKAVSDNCTGQRDMLTEDIIIDLEKAFKNTPKSTLKDINFFIKDACSLKDVQCLEDCNVAVSNSD